MKRINIKCPYCGSQAHLRPASVVHKNAAPGEKVYVCARFPACDAYVSAHREIGRASCRERVCDLV